MQYSSFKPGAKNAEQYGGVVLGIEMLLVSVTVRKWVTEDKMAKEAQVDEATGADDAKYCKSFLSSWDFSLTDSAEAVDARCSIAERAAVMLVEDEQRQQNAEKTLQERVVLMARRALGTILYFAVQVRCRP